MLPGGGHRQQRVEPHPAFTQVSAHLPEPPGRGAQAHRLCNLAAGRRPVERSPEVVVVQLHAVQPLLALGAEQFGGGRLGQCLVCRRVAVAHKLVLAGLLESLGSVLANNLQHQQPRLVEIREPSQQALLRELVESREHVDPELGGWAAHRLGLLEVGPSRKDREASEELPMCVIQQVIAPADGAVQRLLPAGKIARTGAEDAGARLQPRQQGGRVEQLDARRRELDGEGKSIEALADAGDSGSVLIRDLKVMLCRHSPLDEELDALELRQRSQRRERAQVGDVERLERELLLPVHVQRCPAAGNRLDPGVRLQQLGEHRRALRKQLLEIVEHEQHLLVTKMLVHRVERKLVAADRNADRLGDRGRHELGIANRRKSDKVNAVRKTLDRLGRDLQAEAGLAYPARPREREQSRALEQIPGLRHLLLAADEAGELCRQVVWRGVKRAQGREGVGCAADDELKEPFGLGEVLEPVQTEVAQRKALRQAGLDQRTGRIRDHHPASVRGSGDAGGMMHVEADVLVANERGLAGVEADADPDGLVFRPCVACESALRLGGG